VANIDRLVEGLAALGVARQPAVAAAVVAAAAAVAQEVPLPTGQATKKAAELKEVDPEEGNLMALRVENGPQRVSLKVEQRLGQKAKLMVDPRRAGPMHR
jgi:hypothetical protein